MDVASQDRSTEYLELLAANERKLAAYVYALVPNDTDAEDVLQDSKMVMWRAFGQFEAGTNFVAWARRVILNRILVYRRQKKREHLQLDDDVLEQVGVEVGRLGEQYDHRRDALRQCLQKLPKSHRDLVVSRYFEELDIDAIASKVDRTSGAVYRSLSRIRLALLDCVRQLAPEPSPQK